MKSRMILLFVLLAAIFTVLPAVAQDGPVIFGDPDAESLAIVQEFMMERDSELLAEDVLYHDRIGTEAIQGRDAVIERYDAFYASDAFSNVQIDPLFYTVTEESVVAEFWFRGTHDGLYHTLQPTGFDVAVPMSLAFQVEDGMITAIRQYFNEARLLNQLGIEVPGYEATDPGAVSPEGPLDVDDVVEEPALYYGEMARVKGSIGELLGTQAFLLWDEDAIDLNQESVLVGTGTQPEDFVPVPDTSVSVTGKVMAFDIDALEEEARYDFAEGLFENYDDRPVIVATQLANLDDIWTPGYIQSYPEAFLGRTGAIQGQVGDVVSEHAFTLYEDQVVGIAGEIVVFYDPETFAPGDHKHALLRINGTVREFIVTQLEDAIGFDLDDDAVNAYSGLPAVVAMEIEILEEE